MEFASSIWFWNCSSFKLNTKYLLLAWNLQRLRMWHGGAASSKFSRGHGYPAGRIQIIATLFIRFIKFMSVIDGAFHSARGPPVWAKRVWTPEWNAPDIMPWIYKMNNSVTMTCILPAGYPWPREKFEDATPPCHMRSLWRFHAAKLKSFLVEQLQKIVSWKCCAWYSIAF